MRHSSERCGKGLLRGGLMLVLALSMWFVFSDVAQAQSSKEACEVSPVQAKFPNWSGQGFEKHYIDAVVLSDEDRDIRDAEVQTVWDGKLNPNTSQPYLQCGSTNRDRYDAPPIEYKLVRSIGLYSKVTFTFRHLTTFIGCNGYSKVNFTENPTINEDFVGTYASPGAYLNNSPLIKIGPHGALNIDTQPTDWKILGEQAIPVENVFNQLRSGLSVQGQVTGKLSSWYQLKTFSADNGKLVAVSYREMDVHITATNNPGQGPASLQQANVIANASITFGIGELLDHYRDFSKFKAMFYSAALNNVAGVDSTVDAVLASGELLAIAFNVHPIAAFGISFLSWASDILPASFSGVRAAFQPMNMTSAYGSSELDITPQLEAALRARYSYIPNGVVFRKLGVEWNPNVSQVIMSGDRFQPQAAFNVRFGLVNLPTEYIPVNFTGNAEWGETLFFGAAFRSFLKPGCYLVSVVAPGTHGALQIAGNFVWVGEQSSYDGVAPQSLIIDTSAIGVVPTDRTCANPVDVLTNHANLFAGVNCSSAITWWSGHPENGPSANSSSLYVPANSVVKVSSNDNGGGETACFATTQTDLGYWRNKIQWAQLVSGGSCPPPPVGDSFLVHTNQGDFRVNVGQTWDNSQHNRQILGFDRQGSANLTINHVNGAKRCWDESQSAQSLQNDGDWWIQTKSITVGSGYCPGMSGKLKIYTLANYGGSSHEVRAGTSKTYAENHLKYSFKFSLPGMSAKFINAAGRSRCWNADVSNLQNHEDYWNKTVEIKVYGTDVCPPPVVRPEVPAANYFANGSNVTYLYYQYTGAFPGLPVSPSWVPVKTGVAGNFDLGHIGHREDGFAVIFNACLTVPTNGIYTFSTASDDGSEFYIAGQKVVDNDGGHNIEEKFGALYLNAGLYPVQVQYFEGGGGQKLGVSWQGPDFAKHWIPNTVLTQSCESAATPTPVAIATPQPSSTPTLTATSTSTPTQTPSVCVGTELLTQPWLLSGSNGAAELYQSIPSNALQGKTTLRITYNLRGLNALGNDASAIIFDQNGWQYISLSNYGQNGLNGVQTVDIPLSHFSVLDLSQPVGTLHTRFWHGSTYAVDITSIMVYPSCTGAVPTATYAPTSVPSSTPTPTRTPTGVATATRTVTPSPTATAPSLLAGVQFKYYEGTFSQLPNFSQLTPVKTGVNPKFDLEPTDRDDNFALQFSGCVNITTAGNYIFHTVSDDGSKLYLNGVELVNNDGLHGWERRSGTINLAVGRYPIVATYFEAGGGEDFFVQYEGPGITRQDIPASVLTQNGCNVSASLMFNEQMVETNAFYLPLINR